MKVGNPLAKYVAVDNTMNKVVNLRKHLACHAHLANSMQTMVTTSITTIPSTIAKSAHRANIVHRVPRFAKNVQLGTNPLKTQHQTKQLVWFVTVDVTKHKLVNIIVVTAVLEHINLKTVPLIVCPATLACINRKRGNRTAQNARKTITTPNPNKPHAKRV